MAPIYAGTVVVLFVAEIFIHGQTARDFNEVDPGFIAYDEVVGYMVAVYLLPPARRWLFPAFIVDRNFDIWKPFPIGWIEDELGLGSGIMADDVIAGVYTLAILHAARWALEHFAT